MEIKLREFDDYSHPRQRPWLVAAAIIVLTVSFVLYKVLQHKRASVAEPGSPEVAVETKKPIQVQAPVAPRPQKQPPKAAQASIRTSPASKTAKRPMSQVPGASVSAQELIAKGEALEQKGNLVLARQAYVDAMVRATDPKTKAEAERLLGDVNMKVLLSPTMIPEKVPYTVRPGDRVESIARKFGTTAQLIAQANRVTNGNMMIRAGDELRVLSAKFSIEIVKSQHEMVLFMDSAFCKRYEVGIGAFDKTPVGDFVVTTKQENPVWYRRDGPPVPFGDEKNILGTRWMSIQTAENPMTDRRGLGIHGTRDETTIGKSLSAGCIRLRNRDVEELYTLIPPGTKVKIME